MDNEVKKDEVKKDEVKKATLSETIENAAGKVAEQVGEEIKKEEAKNAGKKDDAKKEEGSEKEATKLEVKPEDLNEEQLNFAKTLFKALNNSDPNIQRQTIKVLASAAGLDLKEVETKQEVKKVEESLLDLLKAGLGEYDFLAEKLAPVLDKVLKKTIDDNTKDIREALKEEKLSKFRNEVSSGIDAAFDEYENAAENKDLKDEVVKLMDNFKPNKNISHKDYFRSLIVLAANNKNIALVKAGQVKELKDKDARIEKNRNDAAARLASERGAEVKQGVRASRKMGLNDAINEALEELSKEK